MERFLPRLVLLALLLAACREEFTPPRAALPTERDGWALSFAEEPDVKAGEIPAWCARNGLTCVLGNPIHFFLTGGNLHLVADLGPIHRRRFLLALTNRKKLRRGLESKVLIQLTPADFALDPAKYPRLAIQMAPALLPGKGADLRDSSKNDACFYLLLGFGEPTHDFAGVKLPDTIGYVWSDQKWDREVASDPEYRRFLRYISIGSGNADPGQLRTIERNVIEDYRKAYPEHFPGSLEQRGNEQEKAASAIPPVRSVSLMVDSNSVESKAESILRAVEIRAREKD